VKVPWSPVWQVLCRLSGDFFGQMTFMAKNASQGAGWLAGWPKSQQKVSHHFSRDVYMILDVVY
jgi:hypothetical protein